MHQARQEPHERAHPENDRSSPARQQQPNTGLLSHDDPPPNTSAGRPPIWLIAILVLLVIGFVVLHLTGVVGPGTH